MTLAELPSRIDDFINAIEQQMPAVADEVAMNAIAMVKNRIIDRREGVKNARYSTRVMLATKDQFVVKSAFKQSEVDVLIFKRTKDKNNFHTSQIGKIKKDKTGAGQIKKVKRKLWIKFKGADAAVPVMKLDQGYKEFREIQGRPGDHVNLSLTGKMWQATAIVARARRQYTFISFIGGLNKEAQDKLSWNTTRFGLFLAVNDEEQGVMREIFDNRVQAIFDSTLGKA